jgi:hypothetical protein
MQAGSAQYCTPPQPGKGEIFPAFMCVSGCNLPTAALHDVVPSRADDVSCSPGKFVILLDGIRVQLRDGAGRWQPEVLCP